MTTQTKAADPVLPPLPEGDPTASQANYLGHHLCYTRSDMDDYGRACYEKARADLIAELRPVAWAAVDETETVVEALGMNQSRRFDTALCFIPKE